MKKAVAEIQKKCDEDYKKFMDDHQNKLEVALDDCKIKYDNEMVRARFLKLSEKFVVAIK